MNEADRIKYLRIALAIIGLIFRRFRVQCGYPQWVVVGPYAMD
jgi:hypothetical protein